jgi:CheY-like chemotaxis protein
MKGEIGNLRVLLVDDNATNRKILHYQVGSWGMRDSTASSGPGALNVLRRGAANGDPFTIVILDAHMPELSGLQVVRLIRADPAIADVKIVLLTSLSLGDLDDETRHGVDACITKPVKQSQLFENLCAVVGIRAKTSNGAEVAQERLLTPAPDKQLRILLAEDNEVNQRVALYQLRMLEHHVDLATNGVETLKLFEKNEYDVVLMDIHMPELDGYEATAEIRRREGAGKHTRIIAMTANALPEDREKCLAAGMDDYLAKPVQPKALLLALERCTSGSDPIPPATNLQSLLDSGIGDLVPQLISIFLESAPLDIQKASIALRDADPAGLANAAHSLKGSCSNFGATRMHELCQQLEKLGRSELIETAPEILVLIEKEFNRARTELLAVLEQQPV